ncbi:Ribonuclease D [Pseudoclavibacter triregionum]|nr:Ribonuclease D [Pseudoclavibacter triregionum]
MTQADEARLGEGDLDLIDDPESYLEGLERLAAGEGPVAVDAERASGYRYSDRAYLVQLFRRGSGTLLLDPIALGTLVDVQAVIGEEEWIFHAATQDLPCLRELQMDPARIFDTELAARLLGMPRVGLGAVVEDVLGIELAKAHSADDWSARPLPASWLAYAALDVELLVDVRDELERRLEDQGKLEWAREEFDDILRRPLGVKKEEPWRKYAGTRARNPRALAVARELWTARDELARTTDTAPGRLVPDRSLSAVVQALPKSKQELAARKDFQGRASRPELDRWWSAIERGLASEEPPKAAASGERIPPHRSWEQRHPEAHARLQALQPIVTELAERLGMPRENLLTPDHLRRLAWEPPASSTPDAVAAHLIESGARPWQADLVAAPLAAALVALGQ